MSTVVQTKADALAEMVIDDAMAAGVPLAMRIEALKVAGAYELGSRKAGKNGDAASSPPIGTFADMKASVAQAGAADQ